MPDPAPLLRVLITRLDPDLPLPRYACPGDAGLDLYAATEVVLEPGERALIPTGVAVAIPFGYVALVHPRSGLAARHGITILNAPGTIDAGYRGEVCVILFNAGENVFSVHRGDRIAQMVIAALPDVVLTPAAELNETDRNAGGFGSTGVR